MAGSVVNDGLAGSGYFRDGRPVSDGGIENDRALDRPEKNSRLILRLSTKQVILSGINEHGDFSLFGFLA